MLNLEELRAQIKELDDEITSTEKKLQDLYDLRSQFGGPNRVTPKPPGPVTSERQSQIAEEVVEGQVSSDELRRDVWTPDQQMLMEAEQRRIAEMKRFNQNMPRPTSNVQRSQVVVPPNMKPSDVIPKEMADFLTN